MPDGDDARLDEVRSAVAEWSAALSTLTFKYETVTFHPNDAPAEKATAEGKVRRGRYEYGWTRDGKRRFARASVDEKNQVVVDSFGVFDGKEMLVVDHAKNPAAVFSDRPSKRIDSASLFAQDQDPEPPPPNRNILVANLGGGYCPWEAAKSPSELSFESTTASPGIRTLVWTRVLQGHSFATTYELDVGRACLVRKMTLRNNGRINFENEVLEFKLTNGGWFPVRGVHRSLGAYRPEDEFHREWKVEDLRINELPPANHFAHPTLPDGIVVKDHIAGRTKVVGSSQASRDQIIDKTVAAAKTDLGIQSNPLASEDGFDWLTIAGFGIVAAFVCLGVLALIRRLRPRS